MRTVITGMFFLACSIQVGLAQNLAQGQMIKKEVLRAFGGHKALKQIKTLSYTLEKGAPEKTKSSEKVVVNFQQQYLKKVLLDKQPPTVHIYEQARGWEMKGKQKIALTQAQTKSLESIFFYNFLGMLINDKIRWEFIRNMTYRGQTVRVVRVSDPTYQLDLLVAKNGEIVTSSSPDDKGHYNYFADELEYKEIGQGVRFPLVFKVFRGKKLTYEGKFKNIVLR